MLQGRGPSAVVNAACIGKLEIAGYEPHAGLQVSKNKIFLLRSLVMIQYCGNLRDREVACSASERQGSNFESFV